MSTDSINNGRDDQQYAKVPDELKQLKQWVGFRVEPGEKKLRKIPVNPHDGTNARTNAPATWGTFEEAVQAKNLYGCAHIGFAFTEDDCYFGVDIDRLSDLSDDERDKAFISILALDTYSEWSISGDGVHCIGQGKLPPGRRRSGHYEMYDSGRFFVVTGDWIPETSPMIEERQREIDELHQRIFKARRTSNGCNFHAESPCVGLNDDELIRRALLARNGGKFRTLWDGEWGGSYPSQSEADLAICSILRFWVGNDLGRMDRLFRKSGLYREKWERADYRENTLRKAVDAI